ncbi:MAG: response regulator [Chloroherpetonaceae bacterium]|nr:response regulator [Chloroherpetonaceae bacterium]MDW8438620.1 response regulator [Chloroherpetonaceae bacterium]
MSSESRILLVDDEPMVLSSLSRLFEDDYVVFTANGGAQALDIVRREPIKVIISDQRMPGMLGHEVLRQVKQISPNTVRMLLTGYSDLDAIISSVNAGEIFRYINKPWKADNLCNLVRLGVQIYDRIAQLQAKEQAKAEALKTSSRIHIEVEEKHGSVLFVDYDENEVKRLVEKFSKSFDVSGATSVDEAFKELAKRPVSVVVSNVNFADVDGIGFLNAIRQEYPQVVTVILTEVKDATLAVRSINELSVFKYLVKPASDDVIGKTLSEAVEKNKLYAKAPSTNVRQTAETIAPEIVAPKVEESALRLRLRAAQALLSKTNLRNES